MDETKDNLQNRLDRFALYSSARLGTLAVSPNLLKAWFNQAAFDRGQLKKEAQKLGELFNVSEPILEKRILRILEAAQSKGYNAEAWQNQVPQLKAIIQQIDKVGATKLTAFKVSYDYLRNKYLKR